MKNFIEQETLDDMVEDQIQRFLGEDIKHHFQLEQAKNPIIIIGSTIMQRPDFQAFMMYAQQICDKYDMFREDWNGFNVLQRVASRVGGLDIGFISSSPIADIVSKSKVLFLFGADEINVDDIAPDCFVIYQGHHGDKLAYRADVIIPGAAYTEKDATYVNLEGRVQRVHMAVPPPGSAKSDWYALYELAKFIGINIDLNTLSKVRKKMSEISANFAHIDEIQNIPYKKN